MTKRPDFTNEQKEYLISVVDHWYLHWKTRMVDKGQTHNLGRAKEQLKNIIWDGHSIKSDLLWAIIDGTFGESVENDGKTINTSGA